MLRFFRHGDRRLALFNDSLEEDGVLIDLVLTRSETKGRAPSHAPDTGFDRLQAVQEPRADRHRQTAAARLRRPRPCRPPVFRIEPRARADHRQLRRLSRPEAELVAGRAGERRAFGAWSSPTPTRSRSAPTARSAARPTSVARERAEHEGQQWVSATHDGYRERFGLIYARQLFLSADGEDLRGEDRLTGLPGAAFAVRFHLHPSVQASLVQDGSAALLRLPSGIVWRLRAAGAEMSLGESIYLGSGEARKTQQVVLSGTVPPGGATVRWAIRREPRKPSPIRPEEQLPRTSSPRIRPSLPGIAARRWVRPLWPAAVALATGLLTCLATRALIPILRRPEVLDRPNERSSHRVPTPRGGGIAVIGAVLLAWLALAPSRVGAAGDRSGLSLGAAAGGGLMDRRSARPFAGRAARWRRLPPWRSASLPAGRQAR